MLIDFIKKALIGIVALVVLAIAWWLLSATDGKIFTTQDVSYGSDELQTYDVTYNNSLSDASAVILVHGGGFTVGDKGIFMRNYSDFFLKQGFTVMSTNYRLAPDDKYPIQVEDVACAVAHFAKHASEYGVSADKLFIMGNSAGSHLAAMLAYTNEKIWQKDCDVPELAGFIGFSGVYDFDLVPEARNKLGVAFLGNLNDPSRWSEAEPITYVSKDDPPTLLVHGDQDNFVNFENSIALSVALTTAGVQNHLELIPDYNHNGPHLKFRINKDLQQVVAKFLEETL